MGGLGTLDVVALALLSLAALRGIWNGAIRESMSLATLAAACIAVRFGTAPAADWLLGIGAPLSPLAAKIAAGIGVVVATLLLGRIVGGTLRSGASWVGLGGLDRVLGGALGAAEGALVVALVVLLGTSLLGREHEAFEDSRTLAAFDAARAWVAEPDVAAPPPD